MKEAINLSITDLLCIAPAIFIFIGSLIPLTLVWTMGRTGISDGKAISAYLVRAVRLWATQQSKSTSQRATAWTGIRT